MSLRTRAPRGAKLSGILRTKPTRMRGTIGELNERSLHRALKERYAARAGRVETAIDGYVADVVLGDRIVEIQTGSFFPLRRKLPRLLEAHRVTLVHPIAQDRFIVRLPGGMADDGAPDTPPRRRKSPKHGSPFDVFAALTSIPKLLDHPNLTLDVAMVIDEDIRAPYEGRRRRRRDWISVDRRLLEVVETHTFERMADLLAMVDARLPRLFTSRDLAEAMGSARRLGQQAAFCLREAGVCEVCGKEGRLLQYRRSRDPAAGAGGSGGKSGPIG